MAGWRRIEAREPGSDSILDSTAWAASYAAFLADPSQPYSILSPIVFTRDDRDESFSAELRYLAPDLGGPLKTQLGLSYFEETARFSDQTAPARDLALIMTAIGQNGAFSRHADQQTESWAGFGELIWTPAATVEITADLRYTNDQKQFDFTQAATGLLSIMGLRDAALDTTDTFANWSPGVTVAYKPSDTLTVFGKYVRGFRGGGFNVLVNDPALLPYDSEESANYELGFKALLLDRRLDLGASVFYLRIDNALVPQADPGAVGTVFPLQNVGIVETVGLELDLAARISRGLSLLASAGAYEIKQTHGLGADYRPLVPEYTASITADYERPLTATITGIARLGFRHRSGGRVPGVDEIRMDSYDLLDAQLGLRVGTVELAGFVRNALDDNYLVSNTGISIGQIRYVVAAGDNPFTTRAILRDPGAVFGVRLTVVL